MTIRGDSNNLTLFKSEKELQLFSEQYSKSHEMKQRPSIKNYFIILISTTVFSANRVKNNRLQKQILKKIN